MRYGYCGAILGTLLIFLCSTMYSYDDRHNSTYISVTNNHSVDQQQNYSGFTYTEHVGSSLYPQSFSQPISVQAALVAVYYNRLVKQVKDDAYCRKHYKMSSRDVKRLYNVAYSDIVSKLMSLHLSDDDTCDLWYLYTCHCWNDDKVNACQEYLVKKLYQRKKRDAEQELAQANQRRLQEKRDTQRKHYEQIYSHNVLDVSDEDSPYKHERQLALQQTEQEGYKLHEITYEFDEQAAGLMKSQGIDLQQFQNLSGTLFQHQLFQEVAQYYKKAAKVVYEHQFDNGLFVPSILQFGQSALRATSMEQFGLAIQLNDLSDFMAETSLSICKGAIRSGCNLVELAETGCSLLAHCVESPTALSEKFYTLLGRVINTVGNGVSAITLNEDGWAMYANCLEQQYQFSKQYAQEVAGQLKKWCKETTLQYKVELGSQVVFDALLFSMAGKACLGIISQIPEIRFLEGFADISAEYGLATEFGEVGLTSLEKAGMSLMESEVKAVSSKTAQSVSKTVAKEFTSNEKLIKATHNKEFWSRKGANGVANNANGREGLVDKIKSLLSGQKKAAKVRELPDGRIRYYKAEKPSKNPGPTRGSSYVTEYDSRRGIVRCWQESYDQLGRVNRVHPKSINGKDVVGQHYPPIGKEIEFWKTLKE